MDKQEDLTKSERRFLERVAEARERGVTLEEYYLACGLSVGWLQKMRRQLQGKGVVVAELREEAAALARSGKFMQVFVQGQSRSEAGAACRLRHPSGWVIECMSWPPRSWLAECFEGTRHAGA